LISAGGLKNNFIKFGFYSILMSFDELPPKEIINKTMKVLEDRGIITEFVETKEEAFSRLKALISPGSEIMQAGSTTLEQIGFVDLLISKKHPWKNLKDEILAEKDPTRKWKLRKRSVMADYFLGSVQAVSETGELVIGSEGGSQLPSYAYSSDNVIWVVGAQKIVPTLEDGLRRLREYALPLTNKRMKDLGHSETCVGKILIIERETNPNRKVTLIFVNEKLGF
jgi:L-lactate utilization protein LutC